MDYRVVARAINEVLMDVRTRDRDEAMSAYGRAARELPQCEIVVKVDGHVMMSAGPSLRWERPR